MRIGGGAVSIADVTDRVARDLGFVRDFWLNEIRAGRGFALGDNQAAGAGLLSQIQLINPAASGVTILVRRVTASKPTAGAMLLKTHNVGLATDVGAGVNLLAGAAAGAGHVREVAGAEIGNSVSRFQVPANTPIELVIDWSWEIGEGEGIVVVDLTANETPTVTYEWAEVA